jgi:hypothetical protein
MICAIDFRDPHFFVTTLCHDLIGALQLSTLDCHGIVEGISIFIIIYN